MLMHNIWLGESLHSSNCERTQRRCRCSRMSNTLRCLVVRTHSELSMTFRLVQDVPKDGLHNLEIHAQRACGDAGPGGAAQQPCSMGQRQQRPALRK